MLNIFVYGEQQSVSDLQFLVLDILHTRLLTLDRRYWEDSKHVPGGVAYDKAMKNGMSEWYPIDKMPADLQTAAVFEGLAVKGWIELTKEHSFFGRVTACARITFDGLSAWNRHSNTCFRVWSENRDVPTKAKRNQKQLPAKAIS